MNVFLAILSFAIITFTGYFALVWLRHAADRYKRRLKYAESFYEAAGALASDDETPAELLDVVSSMNSTIDDPEAVRLLMDWLVRGRQIDPGASAAKLRKIAVEFFERRPELEEPWQKAMATWFLAVSYQSWWRGPFLRTAIHKRELPGAAARVRNVRRKDPPSSMPSNMTGAEASA